MVEIAAAARGDHVNEAAGLHSTVRADSPSALKVADLTVTFGGVRALSEVSFEMGVNEVVAVVGPNGAGKTTLLNAICGLVSIGKSSQLMMADRSLVGMRVSGRAAVGLGRSYQSPPLLEDASVLDNLRCGAHLTAGYGIPRQLFNPFCVKSRELAVTERCDEVLEFVGLSHLRNENVRELPYGIRKLVDIARAIVQKPALLMLDEPSSGLDSREQLLVIEIVNGLKDLGSLAVLLVEHHMEVVRATSDRVIGMQAGTMLSMGTPTEVLDSPEFQEAVIGSGRSSAVDGSTACAGPQGSGSIDG